MEISTHEPGAFCWADLGTSDDAAAEKFYTSLLGLTVFNAPTDRGRYAILLKDGKQVAALYKQMQPGAPTAWLLYFSAPNVDEAVAKATSLGAKTLMPAMDVMTAGRMALLQDPTGAAFAVWQAKDHPGAQVLDEDGAVCWIELQSTDADTSAGFYKKMFGWTIDPGKDGTYLHLQSSAGKHFGGMMTMNEHMKAAHVPSHWLAYFQVADCDAVAKKAVLLGGQVVVPTMTIDVGTFTVLRDPQGAVFALYQKKG